ncbi:putative pre-16S rRNA nuclease [Nymphaea thermarum]|nr:putative pre-16S rRNA nuclease [Nymphaea thermarum]
MDFFLSLSHYSDENVRALRSSLSLSLSSPAPPTPSLSRIPDCILYGKNLERALRIVNLGGVKRIAGEPSSRAFFLVVAESRRKEEYICFLTHHCTYYSFFYDVCKHQLAARLAEVVQAYTEVRVPDEELAMKLVKPNDLFHYLLKNNKLNRGQLLGLDVGSRYVGLAISDRNNVLASPLSVLVRKKSNVQLMASDFETLVKEYSLAGLVIGCPYNFMGSENSQVAQVKLFVDSLRRTGQLEGLSYTYWDERFTSKCVEALVRPLNLHPVQYKTVIDKFAAVAILQGFLDFANRNLKLREQEKS